jgi:hypothetical protein
MKKSIVILALSTLALSACMKEEVLLEAQVAPEELVNELSTYVEKNKTENQSGIAFIYCEEKAAKKNCLKKVLSPKNGLINYKLTIPNGVSNFTLSAKFNKETIVTNFKIGNNVFPTITKKKLPTPSSMTNTQPIIKVPEIKMNLIDFQFGQTDTIKYITTDLGQLAVVRF